MEGLLPCPELSDWVKEVAFSVPRSLMDDVLERRPEAGNQQRPLLTPAPPQEADGAVPHSLSLPASSGTLSTDPQHTDLFRVTA